MIDFSLVKVLLRETAKVMLLAWIEAGSSEDLTMWFKSDEFGRIFQSLGWDPTWKISVTIKVEEANNE